MDEWLRRGPDPHPEECEVELRPLFGPDDFGPAFTPEPRAEEDRPREVVEKRSKGRTRSAGLPAAGLEIADALAEEPSRAGYHLLPGVCGDLLRKLGRPDEGRARACARPG
jgi:hypothetical protein